MVVYFDHDGMNGALAESAPHEWVNLSPGTNEEGVPNALRGKRWGIAFLHVERDVFVTLAGSADLKGKVIVLISSDLNSEGKLFGRDPLALWLSARGVAEDDLKKLAGALGCPEVRERLRNYDVPPELTPYFVLRRPADFQSFLQGLAEVLRRPSHQGAWAPRERDYLESRGFDLERVARVARVALPPDRAQPAADTLRKDVLDEVIRAEEALGIQCVSSSGCHGDS